MKFSWLKYEVWIFLMMLVLVNALFVTGIVAGILPEGLYHLGRFALLGSLLFGLIFLFRGFQGVWEVLSPLLEWRRSPWLYGFAFAWTLIICLVVLFVKGCITGDFLTMAELTPGLDKITDPVLLRTIAVSSLAGEIVWIGYAVRKLSNQFTLYVSALIVGAFWTMWWLPMAYHGYGIIPNLPILALLIRWVSRRCVPLFTSTPAAHCWYW
jgi:membrane protease YdiL (CAAX protease family)